jgi:glutamyl-tRNA synthetase
VPREHAPIEFDDAGYGHVSFPADAMDDLVLVRTDGTPTYNFANVVDDSNMGITHVIRGDDHLSNTPRQILIYEALGREVPTFAHLPMILGADGKKLSKRHGATNVEEYRDRGYLPDTMVNFLALLGWSLDGETTVIPPAQIARDFSLERVTKKDSVFDEKKLDWLNGVYIREMDTDAWYSAAAPWLAGARAAGLARAAEIAAPATATGAAKTYPTPTKEEAEAARRETHLPQNGFDDMTWQAALADVDDNPEFYKKTCPLVIERLTRFDEIPSKLEYLFWGPNVALDEKSVQKVLLKDGARADEALAICREVLADESRAWEFEGLQEACRAAGEAAGLKPKLLFQPLRVAVCGNQVSPPLFESIELMPREDVLARIDATIKAVF